MKSTATPVPDKITKEKRREYNQTYYDKHRLKMLEKWRENYVSQKPIPKNTE